MVDALYKLTMLLNCSWFAAGFWFFTLRRHTAVKLFIPRTARDSPIYATFSAALPFLGGFNLAFSALALIVLLSPWLFDGAGERTVLLIVIAIAHGSQFFFNLPIAMNGGRQGESYWPVLKGTMLFIFVVDAFMTLLNIVCAMMLI